MTAGCYCKQADNIPRVAAADLKTLLINCKWLCILPSSYRYQVTRLNKFMDAKVASKTARSCATVCLTMLPHNLATIIVVGHSMSCSKPCCWQQCRTHCCCQSTMT